MEFTCAIAAGSGHCEGLLQEHLQRQPLLRVVQQHRLELGRREQEDLLRRRRVHLHGGHLLRLRGRVRAGINHIRHKEHLLG